MYLIALLACAPSGTTDKPADTGAPLDSATGDSATGDSATGDSAASDTGGADTGDSGEAYPAPSVTILAPTAGAWLYDTDRIALEATVTGGRTSPSEVTCAWLTGGGAVVASTGVAADGAVATSGYLAVDTTTLRVECTDLAGQVGT